MRFSAPCFLALSLIANGGFCAGAGGQAPTTSPSQTPQTASETLKVTTKLTIENVTVTDSKGQPVHGLTQADFTIKEDGKPQAIRNFEEYGTEKPAVQAAPTQLPPNVYSNRPQIDTTTGVVNILMFDNVSTGLANHLKLSPEYFMFARLQALKYLQKMPSGTQVAILDLADGLQVVQGFTSDKALLLAAVDSTSSRPVLRADLREPPPRIEQSEFVSSTEHAEPARAGRAESGIRVSLRHRRKKELDMVHAWNSMGDPLSQLQPD